MRKRGTEGGIKEEREKEWAERADWCESFSRKDTETDYKGKTFWLFFICSSTLTAACHTCVLLPAGLFLSAEVCYVESVHKSFCSFVLFNCRVCAFWLVASCLHLRMFLCVCVWVCLEGLGRGRALFEVCETTKQNVVHVSSQAEYSAQHGALTLHLRICLQCTYCASQTTQANVLYMQSSIQVLPRVICFRVKRFNWCFAPLLLRLCCTEKRRWSRQSVTWPWSTTSSLVSPRISHTSFWLARHRTCSRSTLHHYWPSGQHCSLARGEGTPV